MSYGFEVQDSAGRLIASISGPTMHYLGTASAISLVTANRSSGFNNSNAYSHTFRSSSPGGAPLPVIRVSPGNGAWYGIKDVRQVDSTQWDIEVQSNLGAGGIELHSFAPLGYVSPAESYGMVVYAGNGSVNFDSTRKPLTLDGLVTLPAVSGSFPGNPYNQPTLHATGYSFSGSILGVALRGNGSAQGNPGAQYFSGAVRVNGSGAMERVPGMTFAYFSSMEAPNQFNFSTEVVPIVDLARYI